MCKLLGVSLLNRLICLRFMFTEKDMRACFTLKRILALIVYARYLRICMLFNLGCHFHACNCVYFPARDEPRQRYEETKERNILWSCFINFTRSSVPVMYVHIS